MPFLITCFYRKYALKELIVETMLLMDHKRAKLEIKSLLSDNRTQNSAKKDVLIGIGKAYGVTLVNVFGKPPDKQLEVAIKKALQLLGTKPNVKK